MSRSHIVVVGLLLASARPAVAACVTSAGSWRNIALTAQTGSFTAEFDATPAAAGIDGVLGLSRTSASGYTALAAIVRFNSSGRIDARNGGAYAAAAAIPYSAGLTYRLRLAVNVPARTYSAYVRAPGGAEALIGSNYAFRSEQRTATSLGNMGLFASAGGLAACTVDSAPPPDTTPPVLSGVTSSQVAETSAVVSWTTNEPSDTQADYGPTPAYGASSALAPAMVTNHSVSLNGLSAGTLYHFRARSKDAAGNSAGSGDFTFTTTAPPPPAGCASVGASWNHQTFGAQSGTFTAEFDAAPAGPAIDGVLGLSNGPASGYSSLAAIVRFNSLGSIDARNGGAYAAAASIPYSAGLSYRFRLVVDLPAHRYSAYVRPPGASEQLIGSNYAFRSEQASAASLSGLSSYASSGGETVCAPTVTTAAPAPDTTPPAVSLTAPSAGATVSGTVGAAASAADNVGVAGVQFLLDGAPLGAEDTSPPFTASWNSTTATDGSHALAAVARDAAGNRATSASVSVTVNNAAPAPAPSGAYNQAILADRPVMFLAMDTPGSPTQADLSGRGNNGAYKGGAPGSTALPNGDPAAVFNGSSQYLSVPAVAALSVPTSGVLAIESWIKPGTLQFPRSEAEGYVYWLGKGNPSDGYEYANRMYSQSNSAGRPNRISDYAWNTSGGLGSGAYFQDTVTTSQWIHVTDVINMRDKSSSYPTGYISIYKNGVLRGKVRLDQYDVTPGTTKSPFNIGTRNYNSWFQGAIGKVAVYDYELTASQIAKHYSTMTSATTTASVPPAEEPVSQEFRAQQRFLSPALADGVNDEAVFGPRAAEVTVFDTQGRRVFHARRPGSGSSIVWNGRDGSGRLVDSGVYVARIKKDDGDTAFQSLAIVK